MAACISRRHRMHLAGPEGLRGSPSQRALTLVTSARSAVSASSSALRLLPSSRCACARLLNSAAASAASRHLRSRPRVYRPSASRR